MNTYGPTTLATYTASTDALIWHGTRQEFQVFSSFATLAALQIINLIFTSMVRSDIWDVAGLQASITFQPVTENFIQQGIDKGGNPQGVDITKAPYFCESSASASITAFYHHGLTDFPFHRDGRELLLDQRHRRQPHLHLLRKVTDAINDALAHAGQKATYLYMNDAGLASRSFKIMGQEILPS